MADLSTTGAGGNGGFVPKARFVTPDDFLNYTGKDLRYELRDSGTAADTTKAERFLYRAELRLMTFVDHASFRNYQWDELAYHPDDFRAMKNAVLEQALYMFRNGDLSSDSGYDPQRGPIATRPDLVSREISNFAIDILKQRGLFNQVMVNHLRYNKTWL
jgi:hypothetical protein